MPLMRITLTHGAFDDDQRARLAAALTEAACRAESIPDEPQCRMRALVLVDELVAGGFYSASQRTDDAVAGVFVDWQVSTGVLDGARKAQFARDLHDAAVETRTADDGRMVVTSCVVQEVPEGQWAQNGAIRRLPEMISVARFEHLTSAS
ncbi:MAG: 4-oxalocrotonate tautomerase family protein [Actinomycetota bacterium]|nr:4-oxalocrotonate tautomerase family protein [Actinomycetota bacterium]